jgi:cytochrome c oxidase accessory protein FixG
MSRPLPTPVVTDSGSMYQSAAKVYPHEISGRFQTLRKSAAWWLLGMFYVFPWLMWDGRQAVLFDLPTRKFYIFGLAFWPQDFYYLSLLLMIAAFSLFFFTAIAGRLWCGYACPQTVWTEVYIWMERVTEGSRNQRMKLDKAPWTREKVLRKSAKQFLFITFSLWTGFTFVGFFTPIRELAVDMVHLQVGGWTLFWMLFYGFATWGNAGYLREQVCKYMCPYARFQGAMFDRDTLLISYDVGRGEPRGARKKGVPSVLARAPLAEVAEVGAATDGGGLAALPSLGDCIDCKLCVNVCPTGIDIRDGLQYECIACGACVDACDSVMDKLGYPRGLVRYTTENAVEGKPVHLIRPRVVIYALLLVALSAALIVSLAVRSPMAIEVLRDRNALFRETATGTVQNVYTVKILNKDQRAHSFRVQVEGPAGVVPTADSTLQVEATAGAVLPVTLTLEAPSGAVRGRSEVTFVVEREDDPGISSRAKSAFFAPN